MITVCVSNPVPKGFPPSCFQGGGMAAVSLAMPTKLRDSAGRECGRTFLYLQEELFFKLSNSVCFHGPSCYHPQNRFPSALQPLPLALVLKLLLNNTFLRTHAPFRSFTFLLDLGTEPTENQCQSVNRSAVPLGCWV